MVGNKAFNASRQLPSAPALTTTTPSLAHTCLECEARERPDCGAGQGGQHPRRRHVLRAVKPDEQLLQRGVPWPRDGSQYPVARPALEVLAALVLHVSRTRTLDPCPNMRQADRRRDDVL
jgi:hypothetical protein